MSGTFLFVTNRTCTNTLQSSKLLEPAFLLQIKILYNLTQSWITNSGKNKLKSNFRDVSTLLLEPI